MFFFPCYLALSLFALCSSILLVGSPNMCRIVWLFSQFQQMYIFQITFCSCCLHGTACEVIFLSTTLQKSVQKISLCSCVQCQLGAYTGNTVCVSLLLLCLACVCCCVCQVVGTAGCAVINSLQVSTKNVKSDKNLCSLRQRVAYLCLVSPILFCKCSLVVLLRTYRKA